MIPWNEVEDGSDDPDSVGITVWKEGEEEARIIMVTVVGEPRSLHGCSLLGEV